MCDIKQYISDNPRNKLVFCREQIAGFEYVDVGYELSCALKDKVNRKKLPMIAVDALQHILDKNQHVHPEYGRYTAIKNIGILFEHQLNIDIRNIFETNSKDQLLLIQNKYIPSKDTFRLCSSNNDFSIPLNDFNFIKIDTI